ncbi:hypothetical protein N3K66_004821 [Trichothecium roseum]|uniref:Uncharacterized protein n=1 Tax=Trichothecium roseum TaxID=47278 RepID=A0ACC0V3U3_9HYPO|nr:hypothetical protein N3K66_004821 [Trichothecium roseum]
MADFENIAKQFTEYYYNTFDQDRNGLRTLYRPESMLTFESSPLLGDKSITEKLVSLPFTKVKHQVSTLDAQPAANNGIVILVTGQLLVDEEERPMNYTQLFQLCPDGSGGYFVQNDIFKLIYG